MQAMATAGQISLDDLRAAAGTASTTPSSTRCWEAYRRRPGRSWHPRRERRHRWAARRRRGCTATTTSSAGGSVGRVRTVGVAAPTRSAAAAAAAESAAAKQMVLQQLPDLRQGHHMLLQGMGRSAGGGGGGGDGRGSGRDVQALLKATANSAAAGKKLRKVLDKGADKINKSAGRNNNKNELLP